MSDLFARVVTLRMLLFPDPEGSGYRLHGRPLAQIGSDGEILYVLNDHLGTPTALLDSAKTVRWSAEWYPFGSIYNEQGNEQNNMRFPGQWRDSESDIYYNWHRYYDPRTGRYTQADPIGLAGGVNHYAYVGNNPIRRSDIAGLDWWRTSTGLVWYDNDAMVPSHGTYYGETLSDAFGAEVNPAIQRVIRDRTEHYEAYGHWLLKCDFTNDPLKIALSFGLEGGKGDIKNIHPFFPREHVLVHGNLYEGRDLGNMILGTYAASTIWPQWVSRLGGGFNEQFKQGLPTSTADIIRRGVEILIFAGDDPRGYYFVSIGMQHQAEWKRTGRLPYIER